MRRSRGSGTDFSVAALHILSEAADIRVAIVGLDFLDFLVSPSASAGSDAESGRGSSFSPTKVRFLAMLSSIVLTRGLNADPAAGERDFGAQLAPETARPRTIECGQALVGMAQRFPQLAGDAALWAHRAEGRN